MGPHPPPPLSFMTFCYQTTTRCPLKLCPFVPILTIIACHFARKLSYENFLTKTFLRKLSSYENENFLVLVSSTGPLSLTTHVCPIQHAGKDVKMLIVGNKCDVAENKRTVTFKEGQQVCTSYSNFLYIWQF